jgi:hypothetical protein
VPLMVAACLAACSGGAAPAPHPSTTPVQLSTFPPDSVPGYTRYVMAQPVNSHLDCTSRGHVDLHQERVDTNDPNTASDRVVALATITSLGTTGQWDTPDGHRPTQAEIDALVQNPHKVYGVWPRDWGIYTPLTFSIQRVIAGRVGPTVTGWAVGGNTVEGDHQSDGGCSWIPIFTPAVGVRVLLFLGREITVSDPADPSLRKPLVSMMYPYHPETGIVDLPQGPVNLSKALAG